MFPHVQGYDDWSRLEGLTGKIENIAVIPSRNAASTIAYVITNAILGLEKIGDKWLVLVVDGLSSDPTIDIVRALQKQYGEQRLAIVPNTVSPGKGGAMKLGVEIAYTLGASTLVFLDSDLRSITPEWVILLSRGAEKCGFATPLYVRDRYDATITNFVAKPLTVMAYMVNIKQPIGGEFGLRRDAIEYMAVKAPWQSIYYNLLYGTDVFITHSLLSAGYTPCEAVLGSKIHEAKDPGLRLKPMFKEVTGSLFNALLEYYNAWTNINGPRIVEPEKIEEPRPEYIPPPRIRVDVKKAFSEYEKIALETNMELLRRINEETSHRIKEKIARREGIDSEEWADIVALFLKTFTDTPVYTRRDKLLENLYYLWQGRLYNYYNETMNKPDDYVHETLEKQVKIFMDKRKQFIQATKTNQHL